MSGDGTPARSATEGPALDISHVTVRYGDRVALEDVTMTVEPGRYVGLVGPNGSGKSTLFRAILGVAPLAHGEVRAGGQRSSAARGEFAYVPQRLRVEWDFPLTVWDTVMMGRLRRIGWLRRARPHDRDVAEWALERVGLQDRRRSLIGELSGGQQQRVFLARALAQEGRILLLDEPLTGVDTATQELVLALLAELHDEGRTILIATHDLSTAADTCDTLCLLNRRLVAYGPVRETFTPELLAATFGRHVHFGDALAEPHPQVTEHVIHH